MSAKSEGLYNTEKGTTYLRTDRKPKVICIIKEMLYYFVFALYPLGVIPVIPLNTLLKLDTVL